MSLYARFSEQDLAILRERAERAAAVDQKISTEKTLTVLSISLGNEAYVLSVERLRVVYNDVVVVSIPHTPPFVAGIANIRGRITPVLDLAVVLNVLSSASETTKPLLVITRDDLSLALQVDDVGDIVTLPISSLNPLPTGGRTLDSEGYLQGIFPNGMTLLNIDALLNDPAIIVDHAAN